MEDYVWVSGKKFRKGYTTGSCAAAASKAAVQMLATGDNVHSVDIDTPAGVKLTLPVEDIMLNGERTRCSVIKDGGDDPDITTGLKIFADVRYAIPGEIIINTGEGIGVVTLPGLKVQVGKPAINPVPMQMIMKEVKKVLPEGKGVEITLSVPGGEEIARQTYNPKLGIVGGISILGTKGIVEPMSEEAWKESLALELGIMAAKGLEKAVFVFGNYGEDFAVQNLGISKEFIIKTSNFIGFMLDKAVEKKFESILIIGHLGKLVKVAAGIFHTHSRIADARMEILSAYTALEGASVDAVRQIYDCTTTEAAADIIKAIELNGVFNRVVYNASKRCSNYTFDRLKVGTVLFNEDNTLLAMDNEAEKIIYELRGKI